MPKVRKRQIIGYEIGTLKVSLRRARKFLFFVGGKALILTRV